MPTVPQIHDLQLARHAAHCGEQAAGLRACERLLSRGLPPKVEAEVRAARTWYIPELEQAIGAPAPRTLLTYDPARPGWTTFNPTVLPDRQGGLWVIVRSSNYRIEADGSYVVPPADAGDGMPWIRTRHVLLHLDGQLRRIGEPVHLIGPDWPENECRITGMEDLRMRWSGERIIVSGTVLNAAELPTAPGGRPIARIATAELLPDAGILTGFQILPEPIEGRYEKNWVPIEGRPGEWLYAAWEDGHVATATKTTLPDGLAPHWLVEKQAPAPLALRHLRGRSQLLRVENGHPGPFHWLGIFGEATDDGRRMYDHRFVLFKGHDLEPVSWSPPFRFGPLRGVEFCAGLAWLNGFQLVASYGLRDEEAWLALIDEADVFNSLKRIPC
jgi:hypothetical protein